MFENFNGVVLPEDKGRVQFDIPVQKVEVVDIEIRNHPAFSRGGSKQLIATELIEEGTSIGSYGGEIKYYEENDEEDWNNWNPYQLKPAKKCAYYVDGQKIGNEMRYINDPKNIGKKEANVEFRQSKERLGASIIKTGKNKRKKKIIGGFYVCNVVALRDIQPKEEILVDYGAGYWDSFQTWYERKNPFACPECDYRTNNIHNFARHSHHKEKVLYGFCNSKFADCGGLRRHIKNRHENIEKTYNCNKCEFASSTYDKLAYHKRCNHSDTIWKCLECNLVLG